MIQAGFLVDNISSLSQFLRKFFFIAICVSILISVPDISNAQRCNTPGEPGTFLGFGKVYSFNLNPDQEEYWFCVNNPYQGFSIGIKAENRNQYGRLYAGFEAYDRSMEYAQRNGSNAGYGGDTYTAGARFGGPSGHNFAIDPGKYYIQMYIRRGSSKKGPVQLKLIRGEGEYYRNPFK